MARGYPGAFGRHVNALYIWLPLCVLFLLPFVELPPAVLAAAPRPARAAVLLGLAGVLQPRRTSTARCRSPIRRCCTCWRACSCCCAPPARGGGGRRQPPAAAAARARPVAGGRGGVPARLPRRAERHRLERDRRRLRGRDRRPADRPTASRCTAAGRRTTNTATPTGRSTTRPTCPFEQIFGWSGTWDDLPAAHAAAIFFDLLAVALLFLLGRRMRGPTLGHRARLRVGRLSVHAVRAREQLQRHARRGARAGGAAGRGYARRSRRARGAFAALAGLTKFAPLALAPLLATHGLRELAPRRRRGARAGAVRASAFVRSRRARADPGAQPRLAAHDLRAHDRLPVRPRLAVLGLGAVRRGTAAARRVVEVARGRARARRSRSCRGAPTWSAWRRRCAAMLIAVQLGDRTLVLPVHPVVLPARDGRAARAGLQRLPCARPGAGRGIRTCSIESARSGR